MSETWLSTLNKQDHGERLTFTDPGEPKLALHTTEGSGYPTYQGWSVNPHIDIMPVPHGGITGRQFIPLEYASFALRHTDAQQTNRDNCIQIELIGTCLKGGPGYYWPGADDAVLIALRDAVIKPICKNRGIPMDDHGLFDSLRRLSNSEFDSYSGVLGHVNVPQNDHIDPQHFPWDRMMALAPPPLPPPPLPKVGSTGMFLVRTPEDGKIWDLNSGIKDYIEHPVIVQAYLATNPQLNGQIPEVPASEVASFFQLFPTPPPVADIVAGVVAALPSTSGGAALTAADVEAAVKSVLLRTGFSVS